MPTLAFHLGRVSGYAAAGAGVAASMSALGEWARLSPVLRPLWVMTQAAVLMLGVWMLCRGRQPRWLADIGRQPPGQAPGSWQRLRGPMRSAAIGSLWVAWPCGMLQSALMLAALTNGAAAGALAMVAFAIASLPGLLAGPWLWLRWLRSRRPEWRAAQAARGAGLSLCMSAAWALGQTLGPRAAAFCAAL